MSDGPDGTSIIVGMVLGAFASALLFDGCNVDFAKPADRCNSYCSAEYDGGKLATSKAGYTCLCSSLQKASAP